jgi:hypothetical protein
MGLVPAPCPNPDDPAWKYLHTDMLRGFDTMHILYSWHDKWYETYATYDAALAKARNKLKAGRAYNCRAMQRDEFLYVLWKIDRSQIKGTKTALLVFKVCAGRDAGTAPSLFYATCYQCDAGTHHPACSHILTCLYGMYLLQIDAIKSGDVGDGIRGWGDDGKQTSHVRVQAVNTIAQKMPCGRFVRYTGFRQGYVLEPVMDKYIARFQELASDDVPATIVELHAGKAIVRRGPG